MGTRPATSKSFDFLIVGGGVAAGYACQEFVAQGVGAGRVGIVTSAVHAPYERPTLTKAYLHHPQAKKRARLPTFNTCTGADGESQTEEWYLKHGISFIRGRATSIDLKAKTVTVQHESGSEAYSYDKLLLGTGSRPLTLGKSGVKGDDMPGVFYIREEQDTADLVRKLEQLEGKGEVVLVGGSYLCMEAAAAIVGWGFAVTMVFPQQHFMPKLFNEDLARWMEDKFNDHGIKMRKGERVAEFVEGQGGVAGVRLESGETLPCSVAVVSVGATPNVDYCDGLKMEKDGFAVDAALRTSDPSVFAMGDIAAFPWRYGGVGRVEHVDNARKSAAQAVRSAMGVKTEPYAYLPFFYTRLFEYTEGPIVFNFFGDNTGECKAFPRGEDGIGAIWVKDGKVVGALLMGSPGPGGEQREKLQELAKAQPEADEDPAATFAKVGL